MSHNDATEFEFIDFNAGIGSKGITLVALRLCGIANNELQVTTVGRAQFMETLTRMKMKESCMAMKFSSHGDSSEITQQESIFTTNCPSSEFHDVSYQYKSEDYDISSEPFTQISEL
jgi:hypothetical protein